MIKMQKKHLLPVFSLIFAGHALRDYMQYRGIDNLYTNINHMAIPREWELVSMAGFIILSCAYVAFYIKLNRSER